MADAVAHCHSHGAVHGQLHPENVLLRTGGSEPTVQLTGFLCASSASDAAQPPGGGDGQHEIQLRPDHPLDAPELGGRSTATLTELQPCDIWSLGVLLVYLLTGTPSTDAGAEACAPRPSEADADVNGVHPGGLSSEVVRLAGMMLAKEPSKRPTAVQLQEELTGMGIVP